MRAMLSLVVDSIQACVLIFLFLAGWCEIKRMILKKEEKDGSN